MHEKLAVFILLIGLALFSPSFISTADGVHDIHGRFMTTGNTTYLSVSIENLPSAIDDGSTVNISITIETDDTNGTSMNLLVESTAGLFENNQSSISFQFDAANLTKFVLWTAPTLTETDIDVTISATANLGDLVATDTQNVHVNVVFLDFTVQWMVDETYYQNRTGTIALKVLDRATFIPVEQAEVSLSLEAGIFVSTGSDGASATTDSNGTVEMTVDFTPQEFVFDENEVLISATISKAKYNELLTNTTITVIKSPPVPSVSVSFESFEMDGIIHAEFTINASISNRPWINATFRITATGGSFENGEATATVRTNTSGIAVLQWSATGIPQVKDDVTVYFTVELLTVDYGSVYGPETFNVTIGGISTSVSFPTQTSDVALPFLPLAIAIPFLRRKRT